MAMAKGGIIKGSQGWRVEWNAVICAPWFDRWGEAFAYLMALRHGIRLRMEERPGGWLICAGTIDGQALNSTDKARKADARQFAASTNGITVYEYLSKRRSGPVVVEEWGKVARPRKPRVKPMDALATIAGNSKDGRTPEERRRAYAKTAREARKARVHEAALQRGTLASHMQQANAEPKIPKKFVMPELPAEKPREIDEPEQPFIQSMPAMPQLPTSDEPLFKYSKEEFYGTDLPQAAPHPDHKKRGRPKKAEPVPELPAMFRKINGRD